MSKLHRRAVLTGSALSARVSQWTQRGVLKSLQAGVIDLNNVLTNTATLSPTVDPNNSLLLFLGQTIASTSPNTSLYARLAFTSGTTITATNLVSAAVTQLSSFLVVEFVPGVIKTVQRNTILLNGVTSNTAAITPAMTLSKTLATALGFTYDSASFDASFLPKLVVTSGTVLTATTGTAPFFDVTIGYQLAEFY